MSTDLARTAEDAATDSLFENLVTQFADALDCFRELAQNSMDAGSPQIDVWTEYEASDGHVGTIALHVDDYGEGMDEYIIDDQLTRLFASAKENDLTKIGKFGIGFVSVFALNPDAILVHTGRAGEYWEIFFHPDRSFTKTRLDMPVEGTQVTLFVKGDAERYAEFVDQIPVTLKRWCSHSETEITFEDRTPIRGGTPYVRRMNEPFEVKGECASIFDFPGGTQIAMAFNPYPEYGFYNRGLTLAQTNVGDNVMSVARTARLRSVSMKIKSRYLEHTLSRDTVVRDDNYVQAMFYVDDAHKKLIGVMLSEIESLTGRPKWTLDEMHGYASLLSYLALEKDLPDSILEAKIFRDMHNQRAYSPHDLWEVHRRDGRLLISESGTELTASLSKMGIPIVMGRTGGVAVWGDQLELSHPLDGVSLLVTRFVALRDKSRFWGAIKAWFKDPAVKIKESLCVPELVYLPVDVDSDVDEGLKPLLDGALECLEGTQCGYKKLGTFAPVGQDSPFFVIGKELGGLMARPGPMADHKSQEVAVNRRHPHFLRLVELYKSRPAMAVYCLAKALLLQEDRLIGADVELMRIARQGRS